VTVLLVEQMAAQALALADRAYVLDRGRITLEGPAREVRENPAVMDAYLGRRGARSRLEGRAP
jgi:branched-chain amino acid transport system ATP-binding protein